MIVTKLIDGKHMAIVFKGHMFATDASLTSSFPLVPENICGL